VQGLVLLVVGMAALFAAMALLILAMVLLERIFRGRDLVPDKLEPGEAVSSLSRDTEHEEVVAAIAVALAYLRSLELRQSGLGSALEAGHGPWWAGGRVQPSAARTWPSSKSSGRS
jgi:Na+-transporting methylmalonyl-CoA/oxaloacetate decarboxylase gamma subunit